MGCFSFETGCPCGVRCCRFTIFLLYIGPIFFFKSILKMWVCKFHRMGIVYSYYMNIYIYIYIYIYTYKESDSWYILVYPYLGILVCFAFIFILRKAFKCFSTYFRYFWRLKTFLGPHRLSVGFSNISRAALLDTFMILAMMYHSIGACCKYWALIVGGLSRWLVVVLPIIYDLLILFTKQWTHFTNVLYLWIHPLSMIMIWI